MFLLFLLFFSTAFSLLATCLQFRARQNAENDEAYEPVLRTYGANKRKKPAKPADKKKGTVRLDPENQFANDDTSLSATTVTSVVAGPTSDTQDEEPKEDLGSIHLVPKKNRTSTSNYAYQKKGVDTNLASTQDSTYTSDSTLPDATLRDVPSLIADEVTLVPYRSDEDVVLARNEYYEDSQRSMSLLNYHGLLLPSTEDATCEATRVKMTNSDVTTASLPWK